MKVSNTVCWVDIPVHDLDRAIAFYGHVFNEPVKKYDEHGFVFGLLPHTDDNVSGCLCVKDDCKPSQNGSLVYFNVEGRLDHALKAALAHGGKLLKDKQQIGPYGHRAVILDTEGNAVALYSKQA